MARPVRGLRARNPVYASFAFSYEKYTKQPGFTLVSDRAPTNFLVESSQKILN
jgi:hypothetical protein